jgi:hypothetical protein
VPASMSRSPLADDSCTSSDELSTKVSAIG